MGPNGRPIMDPAGPPQSRVGHSTKLDRRRPTRPSHRQTTLGKWPRPQQKALGASSWKRPGGSYIVGGTWGYLGGSRGDLEGVLEATEGVLTAMLSKMALRRPRKVEYIEKHCEKHNSGSSRGVSWAHLGGSWGRFGGLWSRLGSSCRRLGGP